MVDKIDKFMHISQTKAFADDEIELRFSQGNVGTKITIEKSEKQLDELIRFFNNLKYKLYPIDIKFQKWEKMA